MKEGRFRFSAVFISLAIIALAGCQTKPAAKASGADVNTIQAEAGGLSPTGDEHFKSVRLALLFGNPEAVKSWSVKIAARDNVVRSFSGSASEIPESIVWDGKDNKGQMAAEGSYVATLAVDYGAGHAPSGATTNPFILDISPPSASFSPNPAQIDYAAQGGKAPIWITVAAKPGLATIASWTIDIFDSGGEQVNSLAGNWPSDKVSWDGKTERGDPISGGEAYSALLTIRDEFGNAGKFQGIFEVADMPSAQPSSITARRSGFSPTSASVKNTLDLLTTYGSRGSVVGWKVSVMSATRGEVRSFSGDGSNLPEYSRWDGKDDSGVLAADGSYYATLSVDYGTVYKAAMVSSESSSLVTNPPLGSIAVDPPIVTLSELGPKNPVNFIVEARAPFARIVSWTMNVVDSKGTSLALFHANWPVNKASWDGRLIQGGYLSPGATYSVVAKVQDEYGNVGDLKGSLFTEELALPSEPSSISALLPGFAPTGDKSFGAMNFGLEVGEHSSTSDWRVDIVGSDGVVQKSFEGKTAKARSFLAWDGRKDDGNLAPEGSYTAKLHVSYGLDYAPVEASTGVFVLDLTPPEVGINLSTDLFSPGGEGGSPTATISLEAKSAIAKITRWSVDILDPTDVFFAHFKGDWASSRSVDWDGKGTNGDLVESASDYTIVAHVRDEYGNVGEFRKVLPIDILVFKTQDGYRIRVSSIVFKGFTADFKDVPPDRAARNQATLNLLAKKLALFPDYSVKLQGYAVMVNWDDKAAGALEQRTILLPLSKARAEAIKTALVDRGLVGARMSTDGLGADDPVVKNSDLQNRWKNRRVEFFLSK
jgi:flagellar hook assembly protein FlgD